VCSGNWPYVKQAWERSPFVFLGTVETADPDQDPSRTIVSARDGSFALPVILGMAGQLAGQLAVMEQILGSCPAFKPGPPRAGIFRFMDAKPISISVDADHPNLKLGLPFPSCKSGPPGKPK
jgi:hypothetical protein